MFKRSSSPQRDAPRLQAMDIDDLSCLSALLQDALIRVGDLAFLPEQRRFAFIGYRYDWAAAERGARGHDAGTGQLVDRNSEPCSRERFVARDRG